MYLLSIIIQTKHQYTSNLTSNMPYTVVHLIKCSQNYPFKHNGKFNPISMVFSANECIKTEFDDFSSSIECIRVTVYCTAKCKHKSFFYVHNVSLFVIRFLLLKFQLISHFIVQISIQFVCI